MAWKAWIIFATFRAVFVKMPVPNGVNCITNGMSIGFRRSLTGVGVMLCQAAQFLALSAVAVRRALAGCIVIHGAPLGASSVSARG